MGDQQAFMEEYPDTPCYLVTRSMEDGSRSRQDLQWIDGPSVSGMRTWEFARKYHFDDKSRGLSHKNLILGLALIHARVLTSAHKPSGRTLRNSDLVVFSAGPGNPLENPLCDTLREWSRDKDVNDLTTGVDPTILDRVAVLQTLIDDPSGGPYGIHDVLDGLTMEMRLYSQMTRIEELWDDVNNIFFRDPRSAP